MLTSVAGTSVASEWGAVAPIGEELREEVPATPAWIAGADPFDEFEDDDFDDEFDDDFEEEWDDDPLGDEFPSEFGDNDFDTDDDDVEVEPVIDDDEEGTATGDKFSDDADFDD